MQPNTFLNCIVDNEHQRGYPSHHDSRRRQTGAYTYLPRATYAHLARQPVLRSVMSSPLRTNVERNTNTHEYTRVSASTLAEEQVAPNHVSTHRAWLRILNVRACARAHKFTHAIARIRTCHQSAPGRPRVLRLHLAKHVIEQKMKGSLAI